MTNHCVTVNVCNKPSTPATIIILKWVLLVLIYFNEFPASAQPMLWGVASEGGESGIGTIFMTNADGTGLQVKKSFDATPGRSPSYNSLIQAANGKIYGMTGWGGTHLVGVLFEYNPGDGSYVRKHDFNATDGAHPYGGLVQVNNKLYGLTSGGGVNNKGVLFEYDPFTNTFAKKFDFGGQWGEVPYSTMVVTGDGNLYGVTIEGGANGNGVIFKYNPQKNTVTKRKDFDASTGIRPFGGLMLASAGLLYGMTSQGGLHSHGTIYAYDTAANVLTKKFDFSGSADGSFPLGSLIEATNGLLYGMTVEGGNTDGGVLFEYNPSSGALTKKIDFVGGTQGLHPYGSLFQASNGKLYGTTEQGVAGFGGLFEYDIASGNLSTAVTFDGRWSGNGGSSRTTLMQASDGKLYGMNSLGGSALRGVLFSYDPIAGGYQVRVNFEFEHGSGRWPFASLVQGANGKLYGTTYSGGENNSGVLFEYDITKGVYTKKADFTNITNPSENMVLASNGKLYGLTRYGGTENVGAIFEYDPSTNSLNKKIDFQAIHGQPTGALIQVPNGKMYGVATTSSASFGNAILFEYDPASNAFAKKVDFNRVVEGNVPSGTLLYSDGKIYGFMRYGGANNLGTLFQFDPVTGSLLKLKDFDGANLGEHPVGSLVKAKNNKFYGVTQIGGAFNAGTIVEFNPATGSMDKIFDFDFPPAGRLDIQTSLIESSNGKLYGTTHQGNNGKYGMLYEFDIATNTYTEKHNFTGIDGGYIWATLLFVSMEQQAIDFASLEEKVYGDSPFQLNATVSSGLALTYTSSNPTVASVNGNTVTIHSAGTTTITASQGGSPNFHSASSSQVLIVNKADQTITFGPIAEKTTVEDSLNLSASASSGLPITYLSSNPAVATISGNVLTINGDGTAIITATQPGNINYNSANNVMQTLVVIFVLAAEDPFNPPVKLYPNPADHEFIIEHVSPRPLNATNLLVYDYLGRSSTIPLENLEGGKYRCTTTQLAPGLHYVVIPGRFEPKPIVIVR